MSTSADGRIVYSSVEQNIDLWRLPFESARGKVNGPAQRLTSDPSSESRPAISADGSTLIYHRSPSSRTGGTETESPAQRAQLMVTKLEPFEPRSLVLAGDRSYGTIAMHPAGESVLYEVATGPGEYELYELDLDGGGTTSVCRRCGRFGGGISPDGRHRIHFGEVDYRLPIAVAGSRQLVVHDSESSESYVLAEPPDSIIGHPRFSPGGDWVAFHASAGGSQQRQVFVAPFRGGDRIPLDEWIPIAAPRPTRSTPSGGPMETPCTTCPISVGRSQFGRKTSTR